MNEAAENLIVGGVFFFVNLFLKWDKKESAGTLEDIPPFFSDLLKDGQKVVELLGLIVVGKRSIQKSQVLYFKLWSRPDIDHQMGNVVCD